MAAGWLIVERAGGVVTHPAGGPVDPARPSIVAAANSRLGLQIRNTLLSSDD
jgi:fructose-1,6-bisphosphatase/inositol monophosphatase family enzyme